MNAETGKRLFVTGVAIVALLLHVIKPDLALDGFSLGMVALAVLPWVSSIVKSLEVTGVGKLEFQELQHRVDKAQGTAESAEQKAEVALSDGARPRSPTDSTQGSSRAPEDLLALASQYNALREALPSGSPRTTAMTDMVKQMMVAVRSSKDFDVKRALAAEDAGLRLAAYVYLYELPTPELLNDLIHSVTETESKPFNQYWGLQAIRRSVEGGGHYALAPEALGSLQRFGGQLPQGTARRHEFDRIMSSVRIQSSPVA